MSDDQHKGDPSDVLQRYGRRGGSARRDAHDDGAGRGLLERLRAGSGEKRSPTGPHPVTPPKPALGDSSETEAPRDGGDVSHLALDLVLPDGKHVVLIGQAGRPRSDGVFSVLIEPAPLNPPTLLAVLADYGTSIGAAPSVDEQAASPALSRPAPHEAVIEANSAGAGESSASAGGSSNARSGEAPDLERAPLDPAARRFRRQSLVRRGGAAAENLSRDDSEERRGSRSRLPALANRPTMPLPPVESAAHELPPAQTPAATESGNNRQAERPAQASRVGPKPAVEPLTTPMPPPPRLELPDSARTEGEGPRRAVRATEVPTRELDEATLREAARQALFDAEVRPPRSRAKTVELTCVGETAHAPVSPESEAATSHLKAAPPIGVDFGSTYCRVGVFRAGLELISDAYDRLHVPAILSLARDPALSGEQTGAPLGFESLRLLLSLGSAAEGGLAARGYARLHVDHDGCPLVEMAGSATSVRHVCRDILRSLRLRAGRHLRGDVRRAVLAAPASWGTSERRLLESTARAAGLEHVFIVAEPVAALIAHGFRGRVGLFGVYNLGGTFEFSLVEGHEKGFRVVCAGADPWIGGRELDERIAQLLADQLGPRLDASQPESWTGLLRAAEQAKRALAAAEIVDVHVPAGDSSGEGIRVTVPREQLERAARPMLRRSLALVRQVLEQAGIERDALNELVLTGGGALMPVVRRMVSEFFDRSPRVGDAEFAVVRGAAIYAAELEARQEALKTPGDAVASARLAAQYDDEDPVEICRPGAALPLESVRVVESLTQDQDQVRLRVTRDGADGESEPLLELHYAGPPDAPAGSMKLRTVFNLHTPHELQIVTAIGARSFLRSVQLS